MATTETHPKNRKFPSFLNIQDWRIGTKLLVAFLLVLLVPLLISAFVTIRAARNSLLAQGSVTLKSISAETSASIDSYLRTHLDDIKVISEMPEVIAFASNPNDAITKTNAGKTLKAATDRPDYDSVAIVNPDGLIIQSSVEKDVGTDIKFRPYFQEALKGIPHISDPSVSVITNQPAIFFSAPIRNTAGNIVGVVRSRLNLNGIWALVEADNAAAGPGSYGILLDENGIRLAHSTSKGNRTSVQDTLLFRAIAPLPTPVAQQLVTEKRFGKATSERVEVLALPEVATAKANAIDQVFESTADKSTVRHQATVAKLQSKPWFYAMMAPIPTFTKTADDLLVFYLVVLIIIGTLAIIGALMMSRGLTRPIVQLTQLADRISLGELDASIKFNRNDEIGELAQAVRRMQASLQAAIERLRPRRG